MSGKFLVHKLSVSLLPTLRILTNSTCDKSTLIYITVLLTAQEKDSLTQHRIYSNFSTWKHI